MRLKKKPRNLPRIYNNLIYDINGILTERNNEFAVNRLFKDDRKDANNK